MGGDGQARQRCRRAGAADTPEPRVREGSRGVARACRAIGICQVRPGAGGAFAPWQQLLLGSGVGGCGNTCEFTLAVMVSPQSAGRALPVKECVHAAGCLPFSQRFCKPELGLRLLEPQPATMCWLDSGFIRSATCAEV